jgi:hypothetical protein
MSIDPNQYRRHYDSLSDEALLEINPNDLNDEAQACHAEEIERRGLTSNTAAPDADEESPEWLDEAACACTFAGYQGDNSAAEAETAREILVNAGIPCFITTREAETPAGSRTHYDYSVMVPGALNLQATSLLDRAIFNVQLEDDWRIHFEALSDDQLNALSPEVICAGLRDRVTRLERVYQEELEKRRLP